MTKAFLLGNAAIARGAWEAGVRFAAGYPGTPSTEILEALRNYPEIDAQWSANEKVAFDEAMGASIGGVRALAAMKHVGLNVAADSFMVFPYADTNGGFVVVSAEDPGMNSSQNEQDNRYLARMAKVPVLEPSNSQECKDFTVGAFDLSEAFAVPVMLRTTMRSAHTKGQVALGERTEPPRREFVPDGRRYAIPVYGPIQRRAVEARLDKLVAYAETTPFNRIVAADHPSTVGVIACGVAYQYAREVWDQADFFKLGMTYPLPRQVLLAFCREHYKVYVVEEGEAFIEEQLLAFGATNVIGKALFGVIGAYSPERLARALDGTPPRASYGDEIPILPRPPMFCIGCGHRTVFDVLRQLNVPVSGDIGCYTLGVLPPYEAEHTTFSMGASIGVAFGLQRAGQARSVAVIGDSTFIHGGIPSLIDSVYNGGRSTVIILDNTATGMTGHQPHPGTGQRLQGQPAPQLDLEKLVRATGVQQVAVVDTWDRQGLRRAIAQAIAYDGPAVVIARGLCQQAPEMRGREITPLRVLNDLCTKCGACYHSNCPALAERPDGLPQIDPLACVACTVCQQLCVRGAIVANATGA